jgi:hypothetical protein
MNVMDFGLDVIILAEEFCKSVFGWTPEWMNSVEVLQNIYCVASTDNWFKREYIYTVNTFLGGCFSTLFK